MNRFFNVALLGIVMLLFGVFVWNKAQPERKQVTFADPAMNRICHRYIAKQSYSLPHLAITKFTNTKGETGGYADQAYDKTGQFEGALFDKDGNEVNLGIAYQTASPDARKDLTVKADDWLKKIKVDYETETVAWCDQP